MAEKVLKIQEIKQEYGRGRWTVEKLVAEGKIKRNRRKGGRTWYYSRVDCEREFGFTGRSGR